MSKLLVDTPDAKLVDLYIFEICKAYDVPFSSPHLPETKVEEESEAEEGEEAANGDAKASSDGEKVKSEKDDATTDGKDKSGSAAKPAGSAAPPRKKTEKEEVDSLEARFAALKRK